MRSKLWLLLTALTVSTALVAVACGDDDDNPVTPGNDSGADTNQPPIDVPDTGADAGCTFAGFVTNLINTQTTATAVPSTDLGDNCTPATTQAEFAPLFPQ